MIAPIDLGSQFLLSHEATAIFKQFVEAIHQNDMTDLEKICEASFFEKAKLKIAEAHKELDKNGLSLRLENFKSPS